METIQNSKHSNEEGVRLQMIESYTQSQEECPIDFDEFWQWCGYTRKANAKRIKMPENEASPAYQLTLPEVYRIGLRDHQEKRESTQKRGSF